MGAENCKHGNAMPIEQARMLPDGQGGESRHKCATCAYATGFIDGVAHVYKHIQSIVRLASLRLDKHGEISIAAKLRELFFSAKDAPIESSGELS